MDINLSKESLNRYSRNQTSKSGYQDNCGSLEEGTEILSIRLEDNVCKNMQESQETHISNHLDEVVAAVSITSRKRVPNKLPQTALFQPPREKLHLCEERAKSHSSDHDLQIMQLRQEYHRHDLRALLRASSQEYKQAIQELVRCIALTRICYGDSHWKLAEAHVNLAQGYLQLKGFSLQAKQHAEKAKEILITSIVPPYNDNTDVFKCSVELFHTMGRALLSLQKVHQGQKKSKEALPHYQEALEYTEISKGEKSLEYVQVLRELAGAEQALGFHDAAISHFSQAHLIVLSKNLSREEAADSALFVAHAAVSSRRPEHHDVAEQYFQESMAHLKDSEGTGRAKFLSIQDEFCHFLQITGQKERATLILRESLEAKVGAFGDFSPEVAETYQLLGRADLAQGNHSGAHKKLKKCLQIQTLLYGPQDKRTLATHQTVDILSKPSEAATKPRQSPKAKAAFCTSVPQPAAPEKARSNMAD